MTYFPALYGNEKLKSSLGRDFASGIFSHAYILEGPDGSGRMTAALSCAASLSCERRGDKVPCMECVSCRKIFGNISADVKTVSAGDKKSIGVDAVRDIRSGLYVTPNDGDYRVYIIDGADIMTAQAQNALLISLEEPPEFVIFFLLCTDSKLLLETIRSRAPVIRMERLSPERITDYLRTTKNGAKLIGQDEEKVRSISVMCGGSAGRADEMCAEALKKSAKQSTDEERRSTAQKLTEALILGEKGAALDLLRSIPKGRENSRAVIGFVGDAVRDLMIRKVGSGADMIFFADVRSADALAAKTNLVRLDSLSASVARYISYLEQNASEAIITTLFATV